MYFKINGNSYCDPNSQNTVTLLTCDSFQTVLMVLAISNTKLLNFLIIASWVGGAFSNITTICEPTEVLLLDQDKYSEIRTELKDKTMVTFGLVMFFISFFIFFTITLSIRDQYENETEITKS